MGNYFTKCCKDEEEKSEKTKEAKIASPKNNLKGKEKEVVVENLDKSEISMLTNQIPIDKPGTFPEKPSKEMQAREKIPLLPEVVTEKEENSSKEGTILLKEPPGFQEKSNNCKIFYLYLSKCFEVQEIFKSPVKNSKGNAQILIQELREIKNSQMALIKSKQQFLPNQIEEGDLNIDKTKKVTDIFNVGLARKENEEPERPPKIEEKSEELEND